MLCIVAFFVVLVASIVSAKYRRLLKTAASCAWKRTTLRPCDSTFRDDVKNSLLAPVALRAPGLVRPASIAIEVIAVVMVLSLVLSLYVLGRSGLNLYVYGTCDKQDTQACALAAQSCSIDTGTPGFWDSALRGDIVGAFGNEFASLGETIGAIPSRLRTWDGADYLSADASFHGGYREGLPVALEVLDPGCRFCAELFRNLLASGITDSHNLSYLPYPIASAFGSRFANSPLIAQHLEAIRMVDAAGTVSGAARGDWFILEQLFTTDAPDGSTRQEWMNEAGEQEARAQLRTWLSEAGYAPEEIDEIEQLAAGEAVAERLAAIRVVVEDEIHTVAIPTLIVGGGLHSGLVDVDTLRRLDR